MNDAQANDFVNQTSSETPMGSMTRSAKTSGFVYLFLLACMFAASLWCIFSIRSYRSERNDGTEQKETLSLEKMYEKIMAAFDKLGNKVVLTKEHFTTAEARCRTSMATSENCMKADDLPTESTSTNDHDVETGLDDDENEVLVITRSTLSSQPELAFPNCCAICLEAFAIGDIVSWSINEDCNHVFHQFCLAHYFAHARKKGKKSLCPTCRRRFFIKHDNPDIEC